MWSPLRLQSRCGLGLQSSDRLTGLEDPPKGGSVTGLARRCWLLAGGLGSLSHRHLHRLLECPQNKNLRDHHKAEATFSVL